MHAGDDGKSERRGLPPSPLLSDAKRPLWRREEHGIVNKCSEKASISVSLLFTDIDCYLYAPVILELNLQILLLNMCKLMVAVFTGFFLCPTPPLLITSFTSGEIFDSPPT